MDERIKKLAEQALGVKRDGATVWQFYDDELKNFAQLIAAECAQLVQGVPVDTMGYHTADQKIKEHFGVK